VYVLALIGLFVLFIAGVNYVNLSTARASGRAKEVGVKKTMGASRRALVQQFLTEAVVLSVAAMALAAALAEAMLAAFTSTTGAVLVESLFADARYRSEEHTSELQSRENLVCRLLLEKKKTS